MPSQEEADKAYKLLASPCRNLLPLKMTDEGDLAKYLGVKVEQLPNGTIKLSQLHIIL